MLRQTLRDLFGSSPGAYQPKRQQRRILLLSIFAGIFIAVVFGLLLYELNVMGRLH